METKKFILDILLGKNYKLIQGKHLDYSTMRKDGIDSRYQKGDMVFIWGLHEYNKPPTLIEPRPRIKKTISKNGEIIQINEFYDDVMNECLNKFSHEDIYEGIINDWFFDIDNNMILKTK